MELHHDRKLDAPSGTSRLTRLRVEEAWSRDRRRQRGAHPQCPAAGPGGASGSLFGGLGETLTIRHDSLSRDSFMPGVLLAVKRVRALQGLVVGLENIL